MKARKTHELPAIPDFRHYAIVNKKKAGNVPALNN
jgi:hypothetical protein